MRYGTHLRLIIKDDESLVRTILEVILVVILTILWMIKCLIILLCFNEKKIYKYDGIIWN